MGVPKFFRYISERYPLINTPLPANPPQIDNLYLDMNGIIHNCVRSSPGSSTVDTKRYASLPTDRSPQDIFLDVFKYIDNLVSSLPPRRVLYMAIDGVAPRAKMNQQRSRRFRSAKERVAEHEKRTRDDPMYAAADLDPFDSNCITPGTRFMADLTVALRYFVSRKISDDPAWSHLQIILSGAEAPGEGEHKIMAYIRAQRETGNLAPNTRHAVYGLDADLIMLALITHEPHFVLLREKIDYGAFWRRNKTGPRTATPLDATQFGEFELLSIGVLREYIALELGCDGNNQLPYFNVDRITDDFVFFLMLIGNDFLPNLPTLDIADGTLSVMLHLYRRILPLLGGYLTHAGKIHPRRFEFLLAKLALLEEHVLRHRREESPSGRGGGGSGRRGRGGGRNRSFLPPDLDNLLEVVKQDPDNMPAPLSDVDMARATADIRARLAQSNLAALKEEYYIEKFGKAFWQDPDAVRDLMSNYVTGISWTLKYYTEGCRLWRWFYPFHYAPLASDIMDIAAVLQRCEDNDEEQAPFLPFEQLLSVLPPASAWCLPRPFRALMTSAGSPLASQYPIDFAIDMNGKRNDWEAVVLLPFVDEAALMDAIKSIPVSELAREELERNQLGPSILYSYSSSYAEHIESPFGTRLPSFVSHAQPKDLALPRIEPGQAFNPDPYPGTLPAGSSEDLADLPTLGEFAFTAQLQAVGVNVFGMPSRSESLVLFMDGYNATVEGTGALSNGIFHPEDQTSVLDQNGITVGSPIWFGYPWRKAGTVETIASKTVTKRLVQVAGDNPSKPLIPRVTVSSTLASDFAQDSSAVATLLMQKCAVAARKPNEVVVIRSEEAVKSSDKDNDDPTDRIHERLLKRRAVPAPGKARPLKPGQVVMYVGHGAYFACKCTVVAALGYGVVRVQFHTPIAAAREPPFGYRVVSLSQTQRWLSLTRLASELSMNPSVVDTFLGSLRVRTSSDKEEIDLGLGVKYIGRGLLVVGYARRDERNYYSFSEKTVDVLRKYHAAFPGLFEAVEKMKKEELKPGSSGGRSKGQMIYSASDLFSVKHPDEAVKAAAAWLSVQDMATQPLVSVSSDVLASDKVAELERHCHIIQALQADYADSLGGTDPAKTMREVTRASLVNGHEGPEWGSVPAGENPGVLQHFEPVPADAAGLRLGDRVTNRLATTGVPFAIRGTVVGIHPGDADAADKASATAKVEVVFDEAFISGGNLSNKCSDGRGTAVAATSLFIIRPERENAYYTKHYARVAARVGQQLKSAEQQAKKTDRRATAIASAAVTSYADVLKGGGARAKKEMSSSASSTNKSPVAPPKHGAPQQANVPHVQVRASPPVASPPSMGEWKEVTVLPARDRTQRADWPPANGAPGASPTQGENEPGRRRNNGVDARVAAMPAPSWVSAGGGARVAGGNAGKGGAKVAPDTVEQNQTAAAAPQRKVAPRRRNRKNKEAELDQLSEELRRAIGVEKSAGNSGAQSAGGNGANTGGSKRRNRRGGRGRSRGQASIDRDAGGNGGQEESGGGIAMPATVGAGSSAVGDDANDLSAKWEELQEQARASRKR